MELKFFKLAEFDSPDLPGSGKQMKPEFLQKLDAARAAAGIPFKINSGFRTAAHNAKLKGSVVDSSHCAGWAADIHCSESIQRYTIVKALISAGFNRIGIANTFIHVDCDPTKPKNVTWLYP